MERMRAAWHLGACVALATLGCAVIVPTGGGGPDTINCVTGDG